MFDGISIGKLQDGDRYSKLEGNFQKSFFAAQKLRQTAVPEATDKLLSKRKA